MNFLRQGFRKLSSDRQINTQTDRTEIIYHAGWSIIIIIIIIITATIDNRYNTEISAMLQAVSNLAGHTT